MKTTTAAPVTEAAFQKAVLQYARLSGWLVFHDYDSSRNAAGFPDLVLARPPHTLSTHGELIFAELKTEHGRVRPEQMEWLTALAASGNRTFIWRPSDWPTIEQILR